MALKQQAHQVRLPSFPSSGLGTGSPKLELLHTCVPKLELGNKKQKICTLRRKVYYGKNGRINDSIRATVARRNRWITRADAECTLDSADVLESRVAARD
jgi:hypothetical protein